MTTNVVTLSKQSKVGGLIYVQGANFEGFFFFFFMCCSQHSRVVAFAYFFFSWLFLSRSCICCDDE